MPQKVIVLGAGVIGVSSALCIKEVLPHLEVEIVAEQFSPNTTSDGSGGFWEPYILGKTDPGLARDVSEATLVHLKKLAYSSDAAEAGVSILSGYGMYTTVVNEPPSYHDQVDGYRVLTSSELNQFPQAKSGHFHTSVQVDVITYLPWLMRKFMSIGGKVRCAKVQTLDEFKDKCLIVVNCSGMGARDLLQDPDIVPVRGQVLRVHAPWVKHFYVLMQDGGPDIAYILPGTNNVVIGGTADVGEWDTKPNPDVSASIWKAATEFLPMLKGAEIIKSWVGLRPVRSSLRLETEDLATTENQLKVVHNYGHGGSGVTLHWGCALRAAQMVKDALQHQIVESTKSKL